MKIKPILIALLAITLLINGGCGSTPIQNAIKVEAPLITSVNAAMTLWSAYVKSGKATQAQINTIKQAYNTYYNAQLIVKAALEKLIITPTSTTAEVINANNALNVAEVSLINLINLYMK